MNRIRTMLRRGMLFALVFTCWASMPLSAWAQGSGQEEPPQYVAPYALVILGVALGILAVVNPSRRRERPKEDQFAEKKGKKQQGH